MQYRELHQILNRLKMSAEQAAPHIGVSNMTIRRWLRQPPGRTVPYAYEQLVIGGLERMLAQNILPPASDWALKKISSARARSISAALVSLGVKTKDLANLNSNRARMLGFLRRIGLSVSHQNNVDENQDHILKFQKMGADWKRPITTLMKVVRSRKFKLADKYLAYGALFYLLCPLDLIPDSVPLFGYADDFAFVSLAANQYAAWMKKVKV